MSKQQQLVRGQELCVSVWTKIAYRKEVIILFWLLLEISKGFRNQSKVHIKLKNEDESLQKENNIKAGGCTKSFKNCLTKKTT